MDLAHCIETIESNGFVPFEGRFGAALVKQAHDEMDRWFEIDLESRRKKNELTVQYHSGEAGNSLLFPSMHLLMEVFGKSPALDRMFEQALADPVAGGVIRHVGGPNLKLRGYNVRRMTGVPTDSEMEWHRDNFGELGWSLLLTDADPGRDGTTSFVRGSHLYPFCPRKKLLFPYVLYAGPKWFQRRNVFSKRLYRLKVAGREVSASGKAGDFCVFINDIWHGRDRNLQGKRTMVFLSSVFPAEVSFPDQVPIPPDDVLNSLPEEVRKVVDYRQVMPNADRRAYVYRMHAGQRQAGRLFSLWTIAMLERKVLEIGGLLVAVRTAPRFAYRLLKRQPLIGLYVERLVARLKARNQGQ